MEREIGGRHQAKLSRSHLSCLSVCPFFQAVHPLPVCLSVCLSACRSWLMSVRRGPITGNTHARAEEEEVDFLLFRFFRCHITRSWLCEPLRCATPRTTGSPFQKGMPF
ncbi:hypothetical protein LY76DRAFT_61455 [Colletotrichum caudatum]|nr:hypothetical protein LY76DRAFT_61455 [Colletotrichum caudatum]